MFFFSSYDDEIDKVNQYQRLSLEALERIEIGKNVVTICVLNALKQQLEHLSKHRTNILKQQASMYHVCPV